MSSRMQLENFLAYSQTITICILASWAPTGLRRSIYAGRSERAGPDAKAFALSFGLLCAISTLRISHPIHGVALPHQPCIDVGTIGAKAFRDDPLVPVAVHFHAKGRPRGGEEGVQGECGFLAATIRLAIGTVADLRGLRCIDPVEPDPLASDVNGIPIYNGGATGDISGVYGGNRSHEDKRQCFKDSQQFDLAVFE
ncbi:hypothetical protein J2768_000544 [Agrobacterium tumefaciens]|nr:hypothetical protein [Agrobacterium tumefaciens]